MPIKYLALLAVFLFGVLAPIAVTWGAKARAAEGDDLAKTWGIDVNNGKVDFKASDIKSAVWINANEVVVTFANNKTATFYPEDVKDTGRSALDDQRLRTKTYTGNVTYKSGDFGVCYAKMSWDLDEGRSSNEFVMTTLTQAKIDIDFNPSSNNTGDGCPGGNEPTISSSKFSKTELSIAYFKWVDSGKIVWADGDPKGSFTRVTGTNYFFRDTEGAETDCRDKLYADPNNNKATFWELDKNYTGDVPEKANAGGCKYNEKSDAWLPSNIAIFIANKKDSTLPAGEGKLPNNTSGSTVDPGDALKCEIKLTNPLTWFFCPMIDTARELVNSLNGVINDLMKLPTDKLFVVSDTNTDKPANLFYDSWSGFRYIAMGLLVIIALIMVLSQAIGVGPFDAYTIRKVLPRLLAAVVLVSLSWPLMKLAVDITNGLGHSVSGLIYGPFKDGLTTTSTSSPVMGAVLVGAIATGFVFGLVGLLAFMATAALSMLSGVATLIFREMLIMFLVVVAPVAIICSILPNTQIVWKKWSDYFLRALIVFPIFSGVIAIGQVFAVIGPTLHTGAVGDLIQFIGYFGPYFMLPKIFAMSGGAVAAVGSVAQKATAGMRGGLSNYRNKKAGKRIANAGARAKAGDFIRGGKADDRGVRGRLNRTVAGLSTGTKGRFGIGEGGNQAIARNKATFGSEAARDPNFQQFLADSGDAATILAMSGGTASGAKEAVSDAVNGHMASWSQDHPHATPTDISTERRRLEERFNNAYEGARVMGFSRKNAIAAASNIGKHKAMGIATGDVGALSRGIQRLGGSTSEQQLLLGGAQYSARTEGTRLDLGGTIDNRNAIDERAVLMDSIKRTGFSAEVVGAPASTKQISRVAVADAARLGAMSLDDRTETAVMVSEAVTGLQYGTVGEARDNIVQMCTDLGISIDQDPVAIQEQIANAYGFTTTAPSPGAPPGPLPYINFGNRKRTADRVLPPGTSPAPPPSDVRLKKDIVYVGVNDSGIRLYRFKYLWSDTEYVGVMAQEVLHTHPEAVITDQWGYHRVDYGMLGIEFMTHETWKKEHIKKVKDSVS